MWNTSIRVKNEHKGWHIWIDINQSKCTCAVQSSLSTPARSQLTIRLCLFNFKSCYIDKYGYGVNNVKWPIKGYKKEPTGWHLWLDKKSVKMIFQM